MNLRNLVLAQVYEQRGISTLFSPEHNLEAMMAICDGLPDVLDDCLDDELWQRYQNDDSVSSMQIPLNDADQARLAQALMAQEWKVGTINKIPFHDEDGAFTVYSDACAAEHHVSHDPCHTQSMTKGESLRGKAMSCRMKLSRPFIIAQHEIVAMSIDTGSLHREIQSMGFDSIISADGGCARVYHPRLLEYDVPTLTLDNPSTLMCP
ncbi:hypothetical protein AB6D11_00485 [Vibrio splendidus]